MKGLKFQDLKKSFFRGIISCGHGLAAYFAIQQMPLSVEKMIVSARPIFTILFARIFLKEAFGIFEVEHLILKIHV